jgi:hypothetical protein
MPARARPVPFDAMASWSCADILAILLRTVTAARVGLIGDQTWCTSASLYSRPNSVSEASDGYASWPCSLISLSSIYAPALTAGRTITSDPLEPGTAPLSNSNWRSTSTRTTLEVLLGTLDGAQVPGHFLARKHATRILGHSGRSRAPGARQSCRAPRLGI